MTREEVIERITGWCHCTDSEYSKSPEESEQHDRDLKEILRLWIVREQPEMHAEIERLRAEIAELKRSRP